MSGVTPQEPIRAVGIEREDATQKISVITTDGSRLPFTPQQGGYVDVTVPAQPEVSVTKDIHGKTYEYTTEDEPKNVRLQVSGEQVVVTNTPRDLPPAEKITKELEEALKRERLLCITKFIPATAEAGVSSVDLQKALHGRRQSRR
jgi:hypothetical protein